jgi:hypothetical protein
MPVVEIYDLTASVAPEESVLDITADKVGFADVSAGLYKTIKVTNLFGADITAIRNLTPSDDDFIQRKGGTWVKRTIAQVKTDLGISDITALLISGVNVALTGAITGADTILQAFGRIQNSLNALAAADSTLSGRVSSLEYGVRNDIFTFLPLTISNANELTYRGKVLSIKSNSGTLTFADDLGAGFTCSLEHWPAGSPGDVTIATSGTLVMYNRQGHTKLAGAYARAEIGLSLLSELILWGDTKA